MGEDEIAAVHEAAHAVFAAFGRWTKLAGPVVLDGCGGDVVMSTDSDAIRRTIAADPGFDRELPRLELVSALLAGPLAERLLAESGRADLDEAALGAAGRGDHAVIAAQLAKLDPPRPALLPALEREVRAWLAEPAHWAAIERFAAILHARRRLEVEEAAAILAGMRAEAEAAAPAASARPSLLLWLALAIAAALLWRLLG